MKKFVSIIICTGVLMISGCSPSQDDLISYYHDQRISELEVSRQEATASQEAEIEEVDEWGISLDDVDRLAKDAIRKHENVSDYKQDYNKAIKDTDDLLESYKSDKNVENDYADFLEKYKRSCDVGIEYIKSCVDVELTYNAYTQYGEFTKSQKNNIRHFLTMFNSSIQEIEQSVSDMESLLNPIIEDNRKLTDDELKKVCDIYQILTDNVYFADNSY